MAAALLFTIIAARILLVACFYHEKVLGKQELYLQLAEFRIQSQTVAITTTAATNVIVMNKSNLPDYPGAALIKSPLQGLSQVEQIDLPKIAYAIFSDICSGDNGTFAWAMHNGYDAPVVMADGWARKPLPTGYLTPVCLCNGQPATRRIMVRLAHLEIFLPLLQQGYSHMSSMVAETCKTDAYSVVYWPSECNVCHMDQTKTCIAVSHVNSTDNVLCNCYHGFDSVSKCRAGINECSAKLTRQGDETGRELCQIRSGNNCSTDGDSYMCTCYMPSFENKTISSFPNCRGQRPYDRTGADCEGKFCGFGACMPTAVTGIVECRCEPGYTGLDCTVIEAEVTEWSEWSDCSPACGNTGHQVRTRNCKSADASGRYCEGLRRQFLRCVPDKCFADHKFPVRIRYLSDPITFNLYMWTFTSFCLTFWAIYLSGLLIALGGNFQDWKLEALNESGKLALAVDEVCDELLRRDSKDDDLVTFFYNNAFVPRPIIEHVLGTKKIVLDVERQNERKKKKKEAGGGEGDDTDDDGVQVTVKAGPSLGKRLIRTIKNWIKILLGRQKQEQEAAVPVDGEYERVEADDDMSDENDSYIVPDRPPTDNDDGNDDGYDGLDDDVDGPVMDDVNMDDAILDDGAMDDANLDDSILDDGAMDDGADNGVKDDVDNDAQDNTADSVVDKAADNVVDKAADNVVDNVADKEKDTDKGELENPPTDEGKAKNKKSKK